MTSATHKLADPVFRAVGDSAVLIEFGSTIDDPIHDAVLRLDSAVRQADIEGVIENVPAYTSLLVGYNPLITDYVTVKSAVAECLSSPLESTQTPKTWTIPACYNHTFGPDLATVSSLSKLSVEEVISAHLHAQYKVYMYGFAAGYAYLGGTPECIRLPRKSAPVNHVPAGSVIIAGPQALITTIDMPSGWWIIGRTLMTPLQSDEDRPFLFDIGDRVKFEAISEDEFTEQLHAQGGDA